MQAFANTRLANGAGRLGVIAPLVPVEQSNQARAASASAANKPGGKKQQQGSAVVGQKRKRAADALFAADDEDHAEDDDEEDDAPAVSAKGRAGKAPPQPQPQRSKHRAYDDGDDEDGDADDGEDGAGGNGGGAAKKRRTAPEERGFKKPVPAGLTVTALPVFNAEKHRRDPRFDDLCGEFNPVHFQAQYKWMSEEKEKEIAEWQAELRSGKRAPPTSKGGVAVRMTDEEREELRARIQSAQQELSKMRRENGENSLLQQWKRNERKLQKDTGKKPFHLKKSEEKKIKLAARFLDLKKQGGLQKFMQKKTKEVANRDHKYMPHEGRE